jgi:hypothetical protein
MEPVAESVLLRTETYHDLRALPPAALDLCPATDSGALFSSAVWLAEVSEAGLQAGDRLHLQVVFEEGQPPRCVALLPAVYSRLYGSHPGARVLHFLQREEQPYLPMGEGVDPSQLADSVVASLKKLPKAIDVVRASPLDPNQPFTRALEQALRRHGFWVQFYRHARSHYASVAGMRFADYLAQRPRALRESLDLHTRLLMQGGRGEFHFVVTPELVEDAWDTVCFVIGRAAQDDVPESLDYLQRVLATCANVGLLRLGIFSLDGEPVAMQLWLIDGPKARCLRIWSVPGQRAFPIDDVLTQLIALCLIDGDAVEELVFGDVNDAFASDWATGLREWPGLAAFNRRTLRGVLGAIRHIALGRMVAAPRRLWRALTGRKP